MTTLADVRSRCRIDESDPDPCHFWLGAKNQKGYPLFPVFDDQGRKVSSRGARRDVWIAAGRPLQPKRQLSMRCGNESCLNVDHMQQTARGKHMKGKRRAADAALKARESRRRSAPKLNAEKVREMRERAAAGELQVALAREYRVSRAMVSGIVLGKFWRETTPFTGLGA